ncbi:MAG: helix-turn-helix domain-containing protein [Propionibacteriaceae bacterium]|jgi:excisionase family DNA binding protein|nr:helix-turn-helix domain-containing protein [Propionibacteriaceae bacterium]
METLTADQTNSGELDRLAALVDALPLGSELARAMAYVVATARRGAAVVLSAEDELISPAAAASLLGTSRPHLYKLLDRGLIPCVNVGRDRRVETADVLAYAQRRQADRRQMAERLARTDASRRRLVEELAAEA